MLKNFEFTEENKLIKSLIVITGILIVLNIINELIGQPSWQITRLIFLGQEGNFTTWFSSILLAIAAFLAYRCSLIEKIEKKERRLWQLLGLGLLGMSCDEVAKIHEHLGRTMNKYFFSLEGPGWVIILGPFILLLLVFFVIKIKKYLKDSKSAKKFLTFGTLVYITGAFVFEFTNRFRDIVHVRWLWCTEIFLEESFEMLGIILIIKGLTEYYKTNKSKNV